MSYIDLSNRIKIFADGVTSFMGINDFVDKYNIQGFTINGTFLKKTGMIKPKHYISALNGLFDNIPISMPVLCEGKGIIKQAEKISKWGSNIYVKIPIIDTKGNSNIDIINKVLKKGISVNITCVFAPEQVRDLYILKSDTPVIISVFAGRIADTGIDPTKIIWHIKNMIHGMDNVEILWASTREVYNIVQAIQSGCDIITISEAILKKVELLGKNLNEFSKDTVQQFHDDSENLSL